MVRSVLEYQQVQYVPNNIVLKYNTVISHTEVTVGFSQPTYTFPGGAGAVQLLLAVSGLMGVLECPVDVSIEYTDGPKASKCTSLSGELFIFDGNQLQLLVWTTSQDKRPSLSLL